MDERQRYAVVGDRCDLDEAGEFLPPESVTLRMDWISRAAYCKRLGYSPEMSAIAGSGWVWEQG